MRRKQIAVELTADKQFPATITISDDKGFSSVIWLDEAHFQDFIFQLHFVTHTDIKPIGFAVAQYYMGATE